MFRIIALLLLYSSVCYGQKSKPELLQADADWTDGTVMLNDGSELAGLINYNDKTGVVSFKNSATSRVMTSRNLMGFEYLDPITDKQRVYYSLEIPDETGIKSASIFEVIRLFESFAVLSRIEPVEFKKKNNNNSTNPYFQPTIMSMNNQNNSSTKISQRETIWFLPQDGDPTLYLEYIARENDGQLIDLSHDKKKIQDNDIFERCIGKDYPAIEAYAKTNDLSFKKKEDLIKMLDFYDTLVDNKK